MIEYKNKIRRACFMYITTKHLSLVAVFTDVAFKPSEKGSQNDPVSHANFEHAAKMSFMLHLRYFTDHNEIHRNT